MREVSHESFYFEGDERGVILLHSFTSTPGDVRGLSRAIAREGYTVYGPLLSHHGGPIEDTLIDPQRWLDDGRQAIQKLKDEGCQQIVCLGVSLGGTISHQMVIESDDVIAGGSICSPMVIGFETKTPTEFWNRYVKEKEELGWSNEAIEQSRPEIEAGLQQSLEELDKIKRAMAPEFEKVTKPIFIAQGGADTIVNPKQAIVLRDLYRNADVDFIWYEEGGHLLTVGEYRQPLLEEIMAFLNNLEW